MNISQLYKANGSNSLCKYPWVIGPTFASFKPKFAVIILIMIYQMCQTWSFLSNAVNYRAFFTSPLQHFFQQCHDLYRPCERSYLKT